MSASTWPEVDLQRLSSVQLSATVLDMSGQVIRLKHQRIADELAREIRGGRLVTDGTIEQIKRDATRRVTVSFSAPVPPPAFTLPDIIVRSAASSEWTLDVRGPIGPLVVFLGGLPVLDLVVDPFKLEDYIGQFYGGEAR